MIANKELSAKDYVALEAAMALKGIGYNVPTHTHYHRNGTGTIGVSSSPESWLDYNNVIDRPILQKAIEWLRDVHKVSLRISWSEFDKGWFYDYLDRSDGSYMDSDGYYIEYNDAVNDGICDICSYIKENKLDSHNG